MGKKKNYGVLLLIALVLMYNKILSIFREANKLNPQILGINLLGEHLTLTHI